MQLGKLSVFEAHQQLSSKTIPYRRLSRQSVAIWAQNYLRSLGHRGPRKNRIFATLVPAYIPAPWRSPYPPPTTSRWVIAPCRVRIEHRNKSPQAPSVAEPPIIPPVPRWLRSLQKRWPELSKTQDLQPREERLGDFAAELFTRNSEYGIAVTIQPRFGWSDGATGSARVRNLVRGFFYELDQLHTGCPQCRWLSHEQRFKGFVVVEKRNDSPHVHILLTCCSASDRILRSTFLLEVADNVLKTRNDPQDDRWRRNTREFICRHPWSKTRSWAPRESLITQFEPKATAKVQVTFTDEDKRRLAGYITKAWGYSASQLAQRQSVAADDGVLEWFELQDFFPPEPQRAARPWKTGQDGSLTLDLDNPSWRLPGKGILR
jgi:hypothetical protein